MTSLESEKSDAKGFQRAAKTTSKRRESFELLCRRLLFILLSICFNLEIHSISLFLWPIDYSCARAARLHYDTTATDTHATAWGGSTKEEILDLDAVQASLVAASPEDPLTGAQANLLGINYDDISRCYQYRVEFNSQTNVSTVRTDRIEKCKHGLHFKTSDYSLSVIGEFVLACGRFWMTVLIPEAQALSFALGIILAKLCTSLPGEQARYQRASIESWLSWLKRIAFTNTFGLFWIMQLVSIAVSIGTASTLLSLTPVTELNQGNVVVSIPDVSDKSSGAIKFLYITFISGLFCRGLIASSVLIRHCERLKMNNKNSLDSEDIQSDLKERHLNFILFSLTHLAFLIFFWPVSVKFLTCWQQLIWLLTITSCIMVFLSLLVEFSRVNYDYWKEKFKQPVSRIADCDRFESLIASDSAVDLDVKPQIELDIIDTRGRSSFVDKSLASKNNHGPSLVDACEFCLPPTSSDRVSLADIDHTTRDNFSMLQTRLSSGAARYSELTNSTYTPTTQPYGDICLLDCDQVEIYNQAARFKLACLLYIALFNYFLIRAIPNHEFFNPEPVASHLKRRQNYLDTHKQTNKSIYILDELTDLALNGAYSPPVSKGQEGFHPSKTYSRSERISYASRIGSILKHPDSALLLLWATILVTGWPSEASIILLHVCRYSGANPTTLEPKRLFLLPKYTSQLLLLKWLLLGE